MMDYRRIKPRGDLIPSLLFECFPSRISLFGIFDFDAEHQDEMLVVDNAYYRIVRLDFYQSNPYALFSSRQRGFLFGRCCKRTL